MIKILLSFLIILGLIEIINHTLKPWSKRKIILYIIAFTILCLSPFIFGRKLSLISGGFLTISIPVIFLNAALGPWKRRYSFLIAILILVPMKFFTSDYYYHKILAKPFPFKQNAKDRKDIVIDSVYKLYSNHPKHDSIIKNYLKDYGFE